MTTRQPEGSRERFTLSYDNAALTADLTVVLDAPPKRFYIEGVRHYNATGLVAHASNYFNIKALIGAVIGANWSTETGQEGSIPAATFTTFASPSDISDAVGSADAVISLLFDETGTATLPAGRTVLDCVYY